MVGFPDLIQNAEFEPTRPMPLFELPKQVQIDRELAVIRLHHERIAKAIDTFWGHRDCVEYLQQLIFIGGDNSGRARVGFKAEVLEALIKLTSLHQVTHR